MNFGGILAGVEVEQRAGGDPPVLGVEYDSRRVAPGAAFVAIRGGTADGNQFIEQAVARGAVAVITDSAGAFSSARARYPELALARVAHGRRALAVAAANFFGHPEQKLFLSGVTGTNGKTTTAFLLDAMLRTQGRRTVLAGTIEVRVADAVRVSPHTTPESRDLLELFREGVDAGATEAVMEVSSHALDQDRVWHLPFDTAIFTNLTRDHLDYHQTMERYFAAKCRLFDGSEGAPPRVAVVNHDDEYGVRLKKTAHEAGVRRIYTYGEHKGDFHAADVEMAPSGMRFGMVTPLGEVRLETRLTGRVNIYNLLAASAAAVARGLSLEEVAAGAAALAAVPGRFQAVDCGQDFAVVVDYAHTDDALRNVIAVARSFVAARHGRVITLFGCGGDRDRTKRPRMGQAAAEASEVVVLTSDNPRSEDPAAILNDVLPGLQGSRAKVIVEPDRGTAIGIAIGEARPGDLVLVAGKGHEKTQTLADRVIPFDDVAVAETILKGRVR